jgi:hypothetical protein
MSMWNRYKSTRRYRRARALPIILFGVLGGIAVHHNEARSIAEGRDAYLAHALQLQSLRFDRMASHPHSLLFDMVRAIGTLVGFAVIYELIVAVFTAVLPPSKLEE